MTNIPSKRAGLIKSPCRFESFAAEIERRGFAPVVIDMSDPSWIDQDFGNLAFLIFFPSFEFLTSSHPLALRSVKDNLMEINRRFPNLPIFPDPRTVPFYADKYRQYLFLHGSGIPTPATVPLEGLAALDRAEAAFGYPMVVKNRFGAGGDFVFRAQRRASVETMMNAAQMKFGSLRGLVWFMRRFCRREVIRGFFGAREAYCPMLSPPLLAQEFISHERDLKVVVGDYLPVEFHWRRKSSGGSWRMNIDGGGIGEWSKVPQRPLDLCVQLARTIGTRWLNVDLLEKDGEWLISEFSPVWHHYRYKEKDSFVYRDDYNGPVSAEEAANLEKLIIDSYIRASGAGAQP